MALRFSTLTVPLLLSACGVENDDDDDDGQVPADDSGIAGHDGGSAGDGGETDGGTPDSGLSDSGGSDSGGSDGGASDGGTSDGGSGDGGGGDGGEVTTLDCSWEGGGLAVILTGGHPGGYDFGLAETGEVTDPWTGEDCYRGYTSGGGTVLAYCHHLSPSGGFLETVHAVEDIVEGATTLHSPLIENSYYLAETETGDCWVFGHDAWYYGSLGCADVGGPCSGE